jgi:LacI family transcriptional regulator
MSTAGGPAKPTRERVRRKVSLKDVADRAKVHVSTASRALDDTRSRGLRAATIKRVRAAATELGYVPDLVASGLKRGTSKTVGVVVADLDNPYNAPLIRGIARELEQDNFVALVAETGESRERLERLLRHLMQRRVDAIITAATHLDDAEMLDRTVDDEVPVVLAVRSLPGSRYAAVVHDDRTGGALAAQHLIGLGHATLAQLRGPANVDTFVRRAEGFHHAVEVARRADVTITESAVAPTLEEGRRLMGLVLNTPSPPTAVFAPTDVMAVGALEAISGRGLTCPDDISVIGYNDVPLSSHLSPPLTTIRLPSVDVGRAAARMALQLIADPDAPPEVVRLPATLVERRSTGPVPRAVGLVAKDPQVSD